MNGPKTINLLAADPQGGHGPVPSLVATAVLACASLLLAILLQSEPELVQVPVRKVAAGEIKFRVPFDHPARFALAKAEGWVPWDALLNELPESMPEIGRLDQIRYEGTTLELSGTTWDVNHLPQLMLFLSRYPWLKDPVPIKIQKDPKSNSAEFVLQVQVTPDLTMEGP